VDPAVRAHGLVFASLGCRAEGGPLSVLHDPPQIFHSAMEQILAILYTGRLVKAGRAQISNNRGNFVNLGFGGYKHNAECRRCQSWWAD